MLLYIKLLCENCFIRWHIFSRIKALLKHLFNLFYFGFFAIISLIYLSWNVTFIYSSQALDLLMWFSLASCILDDVLNFLNSNRWTYCFQGLQFGLAQGHNWTPLCTCRCVGGYEHSCKAASARLTIVLFAFLAHLKIRTFSNSNNN